MPSRTAGPPRSGGRPGGRAGLGAAVVVAGGILGAVAAVLASLVAGGVVGAVARRSGTIVAPLVAAVMMPPVDATVVGAVARGAGDASVVVALVVDTVVVATVMADGVVGAVARLRRPGTAGGERRDRADREDAAVQTGQGHAPSVGDCAAIEGRSAVVEVTRRHWS
jgi:hypothetical protein